MNRDRIIYFSVLFLMFGACFAVYQFYFKAKLEKYAQDKKLLENLNSSYTSLSGAFKNEEPDTVISQYNSVVESWKDAINSRVSYFNDADWREYEKPPEDVFILQFWYGEQTRKMTTALWEKAQTKYGAQVYQVFPPDVQTMLGVPYAEQWQGYNINKELVTEQLERLSFGISVFNLLMDGGAQMIRQVSLYDPKSSGFIGANVEYSRAGAAFIIEMEDLVGLIEKMRSSENYFNVEGVKVAHPYIGMKYEPKLEVEMFIARTKPKEAFLTGAEGADSQAVASPQAAFSSAFAPGLTPLANPFRSADDEDGVAAPEPTGVAKFWRWFKRTVFFTN